MDPSAPCTPDDKQQILDEWWARAIQATSVEMVPYPPFCVCGSEMGVYSLRREPGHPLFGKLIPCVCRKPGLAADRAARLRSGSGLTGMLLGMTFREFDVNRHGAGNVEHLETVKRACYNYAKNPTNRWLTIMGAYGSGKTHLAAAIANAQLRLDRPVHLATTADLLDHMRSTYEQGTFEQTAGDIKEVGLLVLDDLGAERETGWANEELFQIVNHRYVNGYPLVVTTNKRLDQIEPRIASRLTEGLAVAGRCQIVELMVGDARPGVA